MLKKARESLKAAKSMVEQAEAILKLFPDDKTAARAKAISSLLLDPAALVTLASAVHHAKRE